MYIVYPPATPLGIIETSFISFCVSRYLLTTACPASWYAVNFLSFSDTTLLCFSSPTVTFLIASSISSLVIDSCLFIVAIIAASFKILASSAPVNPAVSSAISLKDSENPNQMILYGEKMQDAIGAEIKILIDTAYRNAQKLLIEHRDKLDAVANVLLEKEKITEKEFYEIFNN